MLTDSDRAPPAVIPLDFALFDAVALGEVSIAAVPLWALPGTRLKEERVERFLAREKWADLEGQLSTNLALAGRSHFGYCNVRRNLKISRCLFTWSDIKDEVSQQCFVR